jgi:hypothetical protein
MQCLYLLVVEICFGGENFEAAGSGGQVAPGESLRPSSSAGRSTVELWINKIKTHTK